MASNELRAYVTAARHHPDLLAHWLAPLGLTSIRARLHCDELAALRVQLCDVPAAARWAGDLALVAAFAGVDRVRLGALLREVGAVYYGPPDPRPPPRAP